MAYETYVEGKIEFDLSESYFACLETYLFYHLSRLNESHESVLTPNSFSLETSLKNHHRFLQDVLLFIEINGTIHEGEFMCYGEENHDVWKIIVKDGKLYKHDFSFQPEKETVETIESLLTVLDDLECLDEYHMKDRYDEASPEQQTLLEKIEEGLEMFQECENDHSKQWVTDVQQAFEQNILSEIEFVYQKTAWKWIAEGIYATPFVEDEKDLPLLDEEYLLFAMALNGENTFLHLTNHQGTSLSMKSIGKTFPFVEVMMNPRYGVSVVTADEKEMSPCDVCVHRLTKVTSGCQTCDPKILELKK